MPFPVVTHRGLHAAGQQTQRQLRILRAVEQLAHLIIMLQRIRVVGPPEFPVKFPQLFRAVDDQRQQPGQRRIKIIQQEFPGPAARRRGDAQRAGTVEQLRQPHGAHGQIAQNPRCQRPLAALILKWLGNGHRGRFYSETPLPFMPVCVAATPSSQSVPATPRRRSRRLNPMVNRLHHATGASPPHALATASFQF